MKKLLSSFFSIMFLATLISCQNNRTNSSDESATEEMILEENETKASVPSGVLENIVDSLNKVYPKAFENSIQGNDFSNALKKAIKDLPLEKKEQLCSRIPFKLIRVQNIANQPGNKYLAAFSFLEHYHFHNESSDDDYAGIDLGYDIEIYGFAAFKKEEASQLVEHVDYRLTGTAELVENPSISDRTLTLGIEFKNASVENF